MFEKGHEEDRLFGKGHEHWYYYFFKNPVKISRTNQMSVFIQGRLWQGKYPTDWIKIDELSLHWKEFQKFYTLPEGTVFGKGHSHSMVKIFSKSKW